MSVATPLTFLLGSPVAAGSSGYATGVTTGTGQWIPIQGGPQDVTITFTSSGTTSGGTVVIEETDDINDSATPSTLYTQLASGFTGTAKLLYHCRIGAGAWVRARVSSDITGGGKVYVTLVGA